MIKELQLVFEKLQDEESRKIFLSRLSYSVTKEMSHIHDIVKMRREGLWFYGLPKGEKDYIFGCGLYGEFIYESFPNGWKAFIDNDSHLWGVPCMGLKYCRHGT